MTKLEKAIRAQYSYGRDYSWTNRKAYKVCRNGKWFVAGLSSVKECKERVTWEVKRSLREKLRVIEELRGFGMEINWK